MRYIALSVLLLTIFVSCKAKDIEPAATTNDLFILVITNNSRVYAINTKNMQDIIDVTDRFKYLYLKSIGPISTSHDRVLYTAMRDNSRDIGVVNADASHEILTTDPAADFSPVWSPNGQSIAFLSERRQRPYDVLPTEGDCGSCDLFILDLLNHTERNVYESRTGLSGPIWLNNTSLVFAQSLATNTSNVAVDQIKHLNIKDGKIEILVEVQHDSPAMFGMSAIPIEISPDQRQLLYQLNVGQSLELQQLVLKSLRKKNVLPDANGLFEVMWIDNDRLLWMRQPPEASASRSSTDSIIQLHDLTTGLTIDLSEEGETAGSPSMSPSGQQLAYISSSLLPTNQQSHRGLVVCDLKSCRRSRVKQSLPDNVMRIVGWVTQAWAKGQNFSPKSN